MHPIVKPALAITAAAFLAATGCSTSATNTPSRPNAVSVEDAHLATLRARIEPPDSSVLEAFAGSGATDITPHELSDVEWIVVDSALARLPALHRRILERHLVRLSFLDLEGGAGSALTSRLGPDEDGEAFAITLRATLLTESLTDFLNTKEANLFIDDGSGYRVRFDAGAIDALTYVLLHEATHVVDQVLGWTADDASPLMAGTWETVRQPAEPHGSSLAARTRFRGAPQIPLAEAPEYYRALRETPYISFYATAAAPEDVAELFAWERISMLFEDPLTLTVLDASGEIAFGYEPLESPLVKARLRTVEALRTDHAAVVGR
jgi:hypothetical protein